MIDKLYKFRQRFSKDKNWWYSRHEFPDFVYGDIYEEEKKLGKRISLSDPLAKEIRDRRWEVVETTDEEEIKKNTWQV